MASSSNWKLMLFMMVTVSSQTVTHSSEQKSSLDSNSCQLTEMQYQLGTAIEFSNKVMETLKRENSNSCPPKSGVASTSFGSCSSKPEDCNAVYECGIRSSGVYTLWPKSRVLDSSVQAYCDMEADGGGWTVIQRRGNYGRAEDYFFKDWDSYKKGFGDILLDFWIGNDIIFAITNQKKYSLRFDLKDAEGNTRWAQYDHFWVDSEDCNYTLHVSGYRGNAGDSFSLHSGKQFTTKDRDNDENVSNCAVLYAGAWWYENCHSSNLNGLYLNGPQEGKLAKGVNWSTWLKFNYSLPYTAMKIKPTLSSLI